VTATYILQDMKTILTFAGEECYKFIDNVARHGFCLKRQIRLAKQFKDETTNITPTRGTAITEEPCISDTLHWR